MSDEAKPEELFGSLYDPDGPYGFKYWIIPRGDVRVSTSQISESTADVFVGLADGKDEPDDPTIIVPVSE